MDGRVCDRFCARVPVCVAYRCEEGGRRRSRALVFHTCVYVYVERVMRDKRMAEMAFGLWEGEEEEKGGKYEI